jgi:hypothetical protein
MDQRDLIAGMFDLKKLTKICNFRGCEKPPSVEALVFEEEVGNGKRRELVSLFLCQGHCDAALEDFLARLGRRPGTVNKFEVFDIGYVTW